LYQLSCSPATLPSLLGQDIACICRSAEGISSCLWRCNFVHDMALSDKADRSEFNLDAPDLLPPNMPDHCGNPMSTGVVDDDYSCCQVIWWSHTHWHIGICPKSTYHMTFQAARYNWVFYTWLRDLLLWNSACAGGWLALQAEGWCVCHQNGATNISCHFASVVMNLIIPLTVVVKKKTQCNCLSPYQWSRSFCYCLYALESGRTN
jgi:hypothetical protein